MTTTLVSTIENTQLSVGKLLFIRRELSEMLTHSLTKECRTPDAFHRFLMESDHQPFYFPFFEECWNMSEIRKQVRVLKSIVDTALTHCD